MKIIFVVFWLILISACSLAPKTPVLVDRTTVRSKPVVHIVKSKNEKLKEIAKWYTKDTANLKKILQYNGKSTRYEVKVGDSILIPENIVKERRPYKNTKINVKAKKSDRTIVTSPGLAKETVKAPENSSISRGKKELKSEFIDSTSNSEASNENKISEVKKPVLPDHPLVLEHESKSEGDGDLDQKRHKYLLELNQK